MERIGHFRKRVDRIMRSIIKDNKDKNNVIVVTHGGVIASFLAACLKADFDRLILGLRLENTCVTLVSFEKERGCLIHVADTLHLSPDRIKGVWPARY